MKRTLGKVSPPLTLLALLAWSPPVYSQVLWNHEDPPQPTFISEAVLNGSEASSLSKAALAKIQAAIHERVALYSARMACAPQVVFDGDPRSDVRWRKLTEKVREGRLMLHGEVVDIQAGWSPAFPQAVALVSVRVSEVLGGKDAPSAGSVVTYMQAFGTMEVDGEKVCTLANPGDFSAAVGDDIILSAASVEAEHNLLLLDPRSDLYPVQGDMVKILRRVSGEPEEILLTDLRRLALDKRD